MESLSEAKAEALMHMKLYLIGRRILKAKRSLEIQNTGETRKMHLETEHPHHERRHRKHDRKEEGSSLYSKRRCTF